MFIRKCNRSSNGWNNADLDVAFQLFRCGMVWDGNLTSKDARDHLVEGGYAVRRGGFQAMTGKGTAAFLLHRGVWMAAFRHYRNWKRNPFVADAASVARALD